MAQGFIMTLHKKMDPPTGFVTRLQIVRHVLRYDTKYRIKRRNQSVEIKEVKTHLKMAGSNSKVQDPLGNYPQDDPQGNSEQ